MALTVTNWATTNFTGTFWNNYQETMKLKDEMFNLSYAPGTLSVVDKRITNRVAANTNGELSVPSVTETSTVTTADDMLVAHEYVGYNVINTEGGAVPDAYARKLAYGLAHTKMVELLAFGLKTCRTSGKQVTIDNEDSDGSSLYDGLLDVWENLMNAGVPETDLYVALNPTYYTLLRSYAPSASRDFAGGIGNEDFQLQGFKLFGMNIMPIKGPFGVNVTSVYGNIASKYQADFSAGTTGEIGFIWHKDAYRIHQVQKPTVNIYDSPEKQSWLVRASEQFGTNIIDTNGCYTLIADAS
jgi:hypothetical protein